MKILILIFVTDYMVKAGIDTYLFFYITSYKFLFAFYKIDVIQTAILEEARSVVLFGFGCCGFLLTIFTWNDNTKGQLCDSNYF